MVPMDTEKNELNSRNVEVEGQTYVVHVLVIKISHHVTFLVRWATTSFKSRWLPSLRLQVFKDLAGAANIYLFVGNRIHTGRRRRELRERTIQPPKQRSFEVEIPSRVHQASFSFVIFYCILARFPASFLASREINMVVLRLSPLALVLASTIVVSQIDIVASAGFSPGTDLFGRFDQLPLPLPHPGRRRGGQLADTMSEALNELRETRVELTALREEMRSMSEQRKVAVAASSSSTMSAGAGESSIMSMEDDDGVEQDVPPKLPKQPKRLPYSLGLTPQLD